MATDYSPLFHSLGYTFKDQSRLSLALTHPSYALEQNSHNDHYQRLEFLGDSVLSLTITQELFHLFPLEREGAKLAKKLNITPFILLSDAEKKSNPTIRPSILEDCLEALIGAIFLDSDFDTTRQTVLNWYGDIPATLDALEGSHNPKGQLQELLHQSQPNSSLKYKLLETSGPDHHKSFTVQLLLNGQPLATGHASSKKAAEEKAASTALQNPDLFP